MGPNLRLDPVTSSDIPTLGRLFAWAFAPDRLRHFFFSHGYDLNLSIHYSQVSYRTAYEDPNKRFLKAEDDATGEIVGFIIWSSIEKHANESEMGFQSPLNKEYNQAVFARFKSRRVNTMIGRRYILLNNVAVSPDHQRQGIREVLLRYFISVTDREQLDTYLQSQMVVHKLGGEDIEYLDTDLDN